MFRIEFKQVFPLTELQTRINISKRRFSPVYLWKENTDSFDVLSVRFQLVLIRFQKLYEVSVTYYGLNQRISVLTFINVKHTYTPRER